MAALRPDYDDDPERWTSWKAPQDVHELVASELVGPVLDVGCGDGRLAALAVERGIAWIGVDSSPSQLSANPHRPVVLADMRQLPFRHGSFHEVTHLWCLYHLDGQGDDDATKPRGVRNHPSDLGSNAGSYPTERASGPPNADGL